jgi:serine/threonine protein kinase
MATLDAQQENSYEIDTELVEITEKISVKIRANESFDLNDFAAGNPERLKQLQQMLPTLEALGDLGHSVGAEADAVSSSVDPNEPARGPLGDYRILREIGRGGMGVVYEAEQISLGRRVALKVLPFAAVLDQRQIQRFKNEALAAAQLDHPHIVDVYGVGCERAVHFYAMRLIEGETLAEVIQQLRSLNQPARSASEGQKSEARGQESGDRGQEPSSDSSLVTRHSSLITQPSTLNPRLSTLHRHRASCGFFHPAFHSDIRFFPQRGRDWHPGR